MASISTSLITYLKTIGGITSLVGTGTSARIYKRRIKQGASLPFIRIEVFEGISAEHLNDISGLASNRIQIDAYGATSVAAHSLAEAIRLAPLQMYRGTMDAVFVNSVTSPSSYTEGHDDPPAGSQHIRYFCSRDYILNYQEAIS